MKYINNIKHIHLGLITALVLVVLLIVVSKNSTDPIVEVKTETQIEETPESAMKKVKDRFVNNCEGIEGLNRPTCACLFDYMVDNYGVRGLMEIKRNFNDYGYDSRFDKAEAKCIYLLEY